MANGAVGSQRMLPQPVAASAGRNAEQNTTLFPHHGEVSDQGRTRGLTKDQTVSMLASRPMHLRVHPRQYKARSPRVVA